MKVKVRNNNIETALRAFKKKASEIVFEYRERQYYDSPSAKRHRAKKAAQTREKRRQAQDKTPTRKY